MLQRLSNRAFFALKSVEQIQSTSKNLQRLTKLQKQFSNEKSFINNAKSFTTGRAFYQSVEKLHEKREPVSTEGYLKSSIKGTYLNDKATILYLNFGEAEDLEFPAVWLRDNCQCHECFDCLANSRIHGQLNFKNDIVPKTVTSNQDSVSITWNDDHQSTFQKEWLCNHSFHSSHQMERLSKGNPQRVPWSAKELMSNLKDITFSFKEVMNDDRVLLKWLEALASVGITKLTGAPLERGQVKVLAKRISYIRKTHYGEEYYIKGDNNATNIAYRKGALQLHSDMPYTQYMPGVVLLHFIIQSPGGGENILSDVLNVVKQLPRHTYETLSKTMVDWSDIGYEETTKFHFKYRAPVLCEDAFGNLERVNCSQPQRDSIFNVTSQQAIEWYDALGVFWRALHDPKNAVLIKNSEGDVLAFDNKRIVHGRADYTDEKRLLCGAFLDWDDIYSRMRILKKELKEN